MAITTIDMLHAFAKNHSIPKEQVDIFLAEFQQPKAMEEIEDLPHDLQTHYSYITMVPEPLKSFITDNRYFDRHETLDLETVIEMLYDIAYGYIDPEDYEDIDIQDFATTNEQDQAALDDIKKVAKQVVDVKFGSVVMDW